MPDILTDDELIAEKRRAQQLHDVCLLHGRTDGAVAYRATVAAIEAEQIDRERRGSAHAAKG